MIEKRRYPRYDKKLELRYATLGLASVEASSVTKNVSKGGARLQVSRLIKKGDALKLEIMPSDRQSPPIAAMGRIVWTKEGGGFEVDAGLRFTKISPSDAARLVGMS